MTQKTKNQHYVPRSYLTRFTTDGTQLYAYDKWKQRSFLTNITNVASERYFYDLTDEQLEKLLRRIRENAAQFANEDELQDSIDSAKELGRVEQRLSQVESELKSVMDELVADVERNAAWMRTPPAITSLKTKNDHEVIALVKRLLEAKQVDIKYKYKISFLVALQLVRTKQHRASMAELYKKSTEAISKLLLRMKGVDTSQFNVTVDVSSEKAQMLHMQQMLDADVVSRIIDTLMKHIWVFTANNTSQPFFTSDNPVVVIPHKESSPYRSYTGYASEGIEVQMPLTPKFAISFYERTHFSNKLDHIEGKVIPLEDENVTFHNSAQINQCYRQIYGPTNNFELVDLTCRERPEICDPDRSSFEVY